MNIMHRHFSRVAFMCLFVTLAVSAVLGCAQSKEAQEASLLDAARVGDTKTVKSLLERGVDVNARKYPEGWTALHYAAGGAHVDTVKLLLASGARADVYGSGDGGKSGGVVIRTRPLSVAQAAQENRLRVLKGLKDGKYVQNDPDSLSWPEDDAADQRYESIVSLLKAAESK